ncbi:MAG: MarR family transcriptional regulator [Veillonellaceae bacterium]|nr:MarR family transcriptional regulator [Veillonellaceae bacterium]
MANQNRNVRMICQLGNSLVKYRNQKAESFGLTSAQIDVLVFLLKKQGCEEINQLDVQNHLMLTNPTVTGIVRRLEEKGFISRGKSIRDARYNCVYLTDKVIGLEDVLQSNAAVAEKQLLQGMSGPEREEFSRLLKLALSNIE